MTSETKKAVKEIVAILDMTMKGIRETKDEYRKYVQAGDTLNAMITNENLHIQYRLLEGYIAIYHKYITK